MAREMLLAGVDPEELKPRQAPEGPQTPRGRWDNFWYHHKWTFWGVLFGVVVLVVLVVQLVTRDPADYTILLVTKDAYMDEQIRAMEMLMTPYGRDLDGDGKVEVDIQNCYMGQQGSQAYLNGTQRIQAHLMAGDLLFFVWEPSVYKQFTKSLSNVADEDYTFLTQLSFEAEGITEEGVAWNWKDDPRQQADVFAALPEELYDPLPKELYFTVRYTSGTAGEAVELNRQCMELLKNFATDQKVASAE
ncbi:MAG: hypothetical protein IKU51_05700 [Clostridia bacterium]|nr:hypothetical protein [Clostridia bacterium]